MKEAPSRVLQADKSLCYSTLHAIVYVISPILVKKRERYSVSARESSDLLILGRGKESLMSRH
jgi:hypothetical protein